MFFVLYIVRYRSAAYTNADCYRIVIGGFETSRYTTLAESLDDDGTRNNTLAASLDEDCPSKNSKTLLAQNKIQIFFSGREQPCRHDLTDN